MSEKISFTKAVIESFSRTRTGGVAKISCSPTKSVGETMEWGEPVDWQKSANLIGELASSEVEFRPNHSDLEKFKFDLKPTGAIYGFHTLRKEVKKGKGAKTTKSFRTELHFSIDFTDPEGAGFLEKYQLSVGESTLRVTYEKEAKQETLPGATAEDTKQGKLEGMVDDIAKRRAKDVN